MGYFADRPDVVKIFTDLEAYKEFCRLNLMNVIFISEKVELLERLKTAMAIRSHSKRNLINGETK